jgi:ATP-dependent DNA helicase RecQ
MCRKKPVSIVQFSGVNGVGQIKLEKYGEEFTALIADHLHVPPSTRTKPSEEAGEGLCAQRT